MVPGLMTQVRLPPDPDSNNCITTICDSQHGDKMLLHKSESSLTSLLQKSTQDRADSIILVYDLDRVETFYRLETHWLPLIERYYNGEVSVSFVVFV
jgi:Ras family protein T1